jgi:hypothetical protein
VQHGFGVLPNTETGEKTVVQGMGRLNHENTVVVPGRWDDLAMLTTRSEICGWQRACSPRPTRPVIVSEGDSNSPAVA